MKKLFENILEFSKLKEKCIFCQSTLRCCLTNYISPRGDGIPVFNEQIKDGRFSFSIQHTTSSYDIKAKIVIDITNNTLAISLPDKSLTEALDEYVAKQALDDYKPYVELYCPNKHCKNEYYISTFSLKINKVTINNSNWYIEPPQLFIESFKTHSMLVQNDWIREETTIYSIANGDAKPIKVPIMDFEAMGKDKLLNRISTIVVFS